MKRFVFRLERVLAWRRSQLQLAEAACEQLERQLKDIEQQQAALERAAAAERELWLRAATATAAEIAAMERFRAATAREAARLSRQRQAAEQALERQRAAVRERRREARLLERLRQQRWQAWRAAAAQQVDQQAEESHRAQQLRLRRLE
jgi:hypothetical protein